MPFYGIAIKLCARLGLIWLLVTLTKLFLIGNKSADKAGKKRILVLKPSRFRGDMQVLERTGKFEFLQLPEEWQGRILYSFFDADPSFEAVFQPDHPAQHNAHKKLTVFMKKFLPALHKATGIDAVISAAVHYQGDYLWGKHASQLGVSFIVFHRECFHTTKERRDFWIEKWKPTGDNYIFDFCIFHNEVIRKNYADSCVFPLEKTASCGALRMDEFLEKFYQKYPEPPKQRQITLFSFSHAVGLGGKVSLWSDYDKPEGFTGMFEDVHAAFARFAQKHPDVECILKPKWGGQWVDEFFKVFERHNLDFDTLPNLKIIEQTDVHQLIFDSSVVCSYGSTTILESSIIGRPVVVTVMNEALREEYTDQIQMRDDLDCYDVVKNEEEFHATLERLLDDPVVPKDIQEKREALFDKWISPVKANACEQYTEILLTQLSKADKTH